MESVTLTWTLAYLFPTLNWKCAGMQLKSVADIRNVNPGRESGEQLELPAAYPKWSVPERIPTNLQSSWAGKGLEAGVWRCVLQNPRWDQDKT